MSRPEVLDPVLRESPLSWFGTDAPESARSTVVYVGEGGVLVDRPPALGERLRHRYWRYEIDTSYHSTSVSLSLPALEEAFSFAARVNMTWRVHDVDELVRRGIRDVRPIIWGYLDQHLRAISRRHSIEKSGAAEEEMHRYLENKGGDIGFGLSLELLSVNVYLDEAAKTYLATRVQSHRAEALASDDHRLHLLQQQHSAAEAASRAEFERSRAEHEKEVEILRAEHARTLETQAANHEIQLKNLRVEFYRTTIQRGGYDVIMLHLMEHPSDIKTVVDMLRAGRLDEYQRAREVLGDLLQHDLMNAAEAEPIRDFAVTRLRTAFDITTPAAEGVGVRETVEAVIVASAGGEIETEPST